MCDLDQFSKVLICTFGANIYVVIILDGYYTVQTVFFVFTFLSLYMELQTI